MSVAKYIWLSILLGMAYSSSGQQSNFSQNYLNLPMINAGFTGIEDFLDFKAGGRQGWNDFNDQNNSVFISAFGSLNKPLKQMITNNAMRVSDPSVYKEMRNNKKLRRKHGAGGILNSKTLGPYQYTSMALNYAYHLPITKKFNWALGTRAGYHFQKVDFTNYTVRDEINDAFYQELIQSREGRQSSLAIDFGTVFYSDDFYIGLSSNNIITSNLSSDNILDDDVLAHYQMQVGKNLNLSDNVDVSLSGGAIYSESYDPIWMLNTRFRFKGIVYAGVGYEYNTRLSLLFGLMAAGKYSIHYSYDKYLSELSNFDVNSHELVIGIFIFNKFQLNSKFW